MESERPKRFWYAMTLLILLLITICILKVSECSRQNLERKFFAEQRQLALNTIRKDFNFDILIFTQHWPYTVCAQWEERHKGNECNLPKVKNSWGIHGVWPTKYHTMGPLFCNDTWEFDIKNIEPIEDEMKEKWINIERGTPLDGLWRHEWDKHGTCAATQIAAMNSQFNYFSTGLHLFDKLSITQIFQQSYIKAGMSYKLEEIHEVLNRSIGNNFAIVCEKDHVTKEQLLFEIRICLDKQLNLHSCDGIVMRTNEFRNSDEIITNCKKDQDIMYPSYNWVIKKKWSRNIQEHHAQNKTWMYNMVNIYKLMRLIQWITL